jgi:hypothetical protein
MRVFGGIAALEGTFDFSEIFMNRICPAAVSKWRWFFTEYVA